MPKSTSCSCWLTLACNERSDIWQFKLNSYCPPPFKNISLLFLSLIHAFLLLHYIIYISFSLVRLSIATVVSIKSSFSARQNRGFAFPFCAPKFLRLYCTYPKVLPIIVIKLKCDEHRSLLFWLQFCSNFTRRDVSFIFRIVYYFL